MTFFNRERQWKFYMEEIESLNNSLLINNDVSLNGNLSGTNAILRETLTANTIHVNELHLSSNTLYIDNEPILYSHNGNLLMRIDHFHGDLSGNLISKNTFVNGNIIIENNFGIKFHDGTSITSGNISSLNNDSGYIQNNDNISLLNNDSGYIVSNNILSVNNSTSRVGIGTTNPQSKLEVNGEVRIQNGELRIYNNGINGTAVTHFNYPLGGNWIRGIFTRFDCPINIVTNNVLPTLGPYATFDVNIVNDFYRNKVGFSMSDTTTTSPNVTRCFALGFEGTGFNYNVHVFMLNPLYPFIQSVGKFENDNLSTGNINFTGQHRCIANKFLEGNLHYGLIVCAKKNRYINFKNELDVTINENLPEVSLSEKENDKSVFGVISSGEDTNNSREYSLGRFTSIFYKTTSNENRMIINSIGEGGIWVSNKNGTLESGDYISSSSIKGYGQKQINNEGILCNYTVAKITCDCEFTLVKKEKKKIKMKDVIVNEKNIVKNPENNQEEEVITEKKLKEFIYDNNGNLQYDNDLDENGNIQYEYEYDTRFLDENANILSGEEEYLSRLNNGENVYIACFVGCTYHCG